MRAHEIMDYIDLDRISQETLRELIDVFDRASLGPIDLAALEAQYGQAAADVELAQARAELAKTRAETEKQKASAARDRAEAARDST